MVKLAEIAEASGFSIPVVSRVLNPNPKVETKIAPKTRQLIQETAERMGYRPNRNAEFLKRGQNPVIGVFVPRYRNSLIADLVMGISQAAQEHGFPVSFSFETSFENYRKFIEETRGQRNCGIITYPYFQVDAKAVKLIENFRDDGGKLVLINAGQFIPEVPHVDIDDYHGGQIAAEHLLSRGCRNFMMVRTQDKRAQGFKDILKKVGKTTQEFGESDEDLCRIARQCRNVSETTGVFCNVDRAAVRLHSILSRMGIELGQKVKLIGYDDLYLTQLLEPRLSTVAQPFVETGRLSVESLINIIYGKKTESILLKPELVARETT